MCGYGLAGCARFIAKCAIFVCVNKLMRCFLGATTVGMAAAVKTSYM